MNTASLEQQFMPKTPHVSVTLQKSPSTAEPKRKRIRKRKRKKVERCVCVTACDRQTRVHENPCSRLTWMWIEALWFAWRLLSGTNGLELVPSLGHLGAATILCIWKGIFSRFSVAMSSQSQSQSQTDIVIEVMIWYDEVYMLVMSTLGNCKKWQSFPNIINRRAYFSSFFSW